MIDKLIMKYKNKIMSNDIVDQIRNDIFKLCEKSFDFNSYKFDIFIDPDGYQITINPSNLATALLFYNGTIINPELTEYEDEGNYYDMEGGIFHLKSKQKIKDITATLHITKKT